MNTEMTRIKNKVLIYLGDRFDRVVFNEYRTQKWLNDDIPKLEPVNRFFGWTSESALKDPLFFECNGESPAIFFPNVGYCFVYHSLEDEWNVYWIKEE
ncbi:hypothetical protein [Streptococcus pluranimalium]